MDNKAVPKYYGIFREKVINGEIPVNREISMQMNRIDKMIKNRNIYYDGSKVEGIIDFCESELTLTDGSDLNLLFTFKLWLESIYGFYYYVEAVVWVPHVNGGGHWAKRKKRKRLTNKLFLIVARGAAKTMFMSCVQQYHLSIDTATTHQIATAPTMRQADEVLSPIRTSIIRSRGPLYQFLTLGSANNTNGSKINRPRLISTKKGIENTVTGSLLEIRPMSIDKLQGLRNKISSVDEWLSCDIREDVIGTLEQGSSKIDDWLLIACSSEGTSRNGVGDSIKMELVDILKGVYVNPHVAIWYYKLDDVKEVADPLMWEKAQPNIGKTVSYETYQQEVERAEKVPSARNDILAKRFDIPVEGYTYFFTYEETLVHRRQSFWQMSCSLGIDLSQGDDFCAFTFLFPLTRDRFGVKVRSYISDRTYRLLKPAAKEKYKEFINEGSLVVLEGSVIDVEVVYDDLDNFIQQQEYDVRCVGYDPYNAKEFINLWTRYNSEYGIEKVIQGSKTETVPLGELKDLATDRKLLFDEKLMQFCMGNSIVLQDTNGNRKLSKKRYEEKIDNVSALMDAYVSYTHNRDEF